MNYPQAKSIRAITQPSSTLVLADWGESSSNVYSLPPCKGAELASDAAADGILEVHCLEDIDGKWYKMPLEIGKRNGALFDKIRTTGSTVDLEKVTCFPI